MDEAIVIYDAECGFCRWSLAVLLRLAGARATRAAEALRPLALGTAEADRLLADLSVAERQASWHLVVERAPGVVERPAGVPGPPGPERSGPLRFSAGAALAPAMRFVPGGRAPAALFRRFPRATERGYRWVADHRRFLGRFVPRRARRWADRVIAAHGSPQ
jgi:predicted DCC family thiol-disulfide oxidoreductase YuxK